MPLDPSHPDYWTEALQFTATVHRDLYPAIDPGRSSLQRVARGKVVVVTGAGSGFGEVCLNATFNVSNSLVLRFITIGCL